MAFGVLAANQPLTAKPSEFLSKHVALRLVRRGWADQIDRGLIRRRVERRMFDIPIETVRKLAPFTSKMPPAEVGGCRFKAPPMAPTDVVHYIRNIAVTR